MLYPIELGVQMGFTAVLLGENAIQEGLAIPWQYSPLPTPRERIIAKGTGRGKGSRNNSWFLESENPSLAAIADANGRCLVGSNCVSASHLLRSAHFCIFSNRWPLTADSPTNAGV